MVEVTQTELPGVLILEPKVFGDARGTFFESWQRERYVDLGIPGPFVQDNVSRSRKGVLRGLHYQYPNGQGKLVQVLQGEVFDVAVDIRRGSPTFGKWVGVILSQENALQMWIPEGFAHGFCVTVDATIFAYKCTAYYDPKSEYTLQWNDPSLGIDWPIDAPELADKDRNGMLLRDLGDQQLPHFTG